MTTFAEPMVYPASARKSTVPVVVTPPGRLTVATSAKTSPRVCGPMALKVTVGSAFAAVRVRLLDVPATKLESPAYSAMIVLLVDVTT